MLHSQALSSYHHAQIHVDGQRFQRSNEIGRGIIGVVYEALDNEEGVMVALKSIKVSYFAYFSSFEKKTSKKD